MKLRYLLLPTVLSGKARFLLLSSLLPFNSAQLLRGRKLIDDPSPSTPEPSGRVIVSRKTEGTLRLEGRTPDEIADIRSRGLTEINKYNVVFESKGERDFQVLEVGVGNEDAFIEDLLRNNEELFEYAELDYIVYPDYTSPNDPKISDQYHHDLMQSFEAWDLTTGSSSVTIAICDTGVQLDHPDLADNRLPGYQATTQCWEDDPTCTADVSPVHPHGTKCAGCAAAIGNNREGVSGVGWNFKHRPGRVSDSPGGGASHSVIADCARRMCELEDVKVVSVSYGGVDYYSRRDAASYCKNHGALMVNGAGNDNRDLTHVGEADDDDLIVAGASTSIDTKASFSAYGRHVDVWAPGSAVCTTTTGSGYGCWSGTSLSSPLVAGVIALIWSINPLLTPDHVERILKQSTDNVGIHEEGNTPYGRINSFKAVQMAQQASKQASAYYWDDNLCPNDEFSPIANIAGREQLDPCDECVHRRTLPFAFPWITGELITDIGISDNGASIMPFGASEKAIGYTSTLCCSAHPIAPGGEYEETVPRISLVQEDLDPHEDAPGGIYVLEAPDGNSVTISWEDVRFYYAHGVDPDTWSGYHTEVNAQVVLYKNGIISFCYGSGNNEEHTFAAGLEDDTQSLAFPIPLDGFDDQGITAVFPEYQCACFVGNYDPPLELVGDRPLGMCQGNCRSDDDCLADLRCFKRESDTTVEVPYCEGGEADDPGKNYCTVRSRRDDKLWLSRVADGGIYYDDGTPISAENPLQQCQGDCDDDSDCEGDLYCFQRGGGAPGVSQNADIPFCWNVGGKPGEDYCTQHCRSELCSDNASCDEESDTCVCNPGYAGGDPSGAWGQGCHEITYTYSCEAGEVKLMSEVQTLDKSDNWEGKLKFLFAGIDDAVSDVIVRVFTRGDLGSNYEFYEVYAGENDKLGNAGGDSGWFSGDCNVEPKVDRFIIPMLDFNSYIAADKTLTIKADATSAVHDYFCDYNDVSIKLIYEVAECA